MYPYFWGDTYSTSGAGVLPFAKFADRDPDLDDLPQEVKAAIEERRGEIRSLDDLRRITNETLTKK